MTTPDFFLSSALHKIIDILFKMADFGDIDRILEHSDADDDDDEGNTSTLFQSEYISIHIKQETIKFHK